jgi:hypothetical protein
MLCITCSRRGVIVVVSLVLFAQTNTNVVIVSALSPSLLTSPAQQEFSMHMMQETQALIKLPSQTLYVVNHVKSSIFCSTPDFAAFICT